MISTGARIAAKTSVALPTSSATLATGAATPPVAAFSTGRAAAFARCTTRARPMPIATGTH